MNPTLIKAVSSVMINYLTYHFLERFEKLGCECGYDVRRDLAKVMLLTSYLIIIGYVLFPDVPPTAKLFIAAYMFIYDLVFVSYIFSLKRKKCVCNDSFVDTTTDVLHLYYMLLIFAFLFTLSMAFVFVPTISLFSKSKR